MTEIADHFAPEGLRTRGTVIVVPGLSAAVDGVASDAPDGLTRPPVLVGSDLGAAGIAAPADPAGSGFRLVAGRCRPGRAARPRRAGRRRVGRRARRPLALSRHRSVLTLARLLARRLTEAVPG